MKLNVKKQELQKYIWAIMGPLIFALGVNIMITPIGLFNGGVLGIAQLIRTLILTVFQLRIPTSVDLSGLIYFIINVPLFILAYKGISKNFFIKTVISVVCMTFFMTAIPIMEVPMIEDHLTASILGGIITGYGLGLTLRAGSSGGGLDILGVFLSKKYKAFSVGKINMFINVFVYIICAVITDIPTAVYSVIFASISAFSLDRAHYQNIMVQVIIITKIDGIEQPIMEKLYRGVTNLKGEGAYTHKDSNVLMTCISKYEISHLRKIVLDIDPQAFIIYNKVFKIDGNFTKILD